GQLFSAVFVNNSGGSQLIPWVHAHIERAVPHQAETAFRIFELPGRNAKVEKGATDHAKPKLVQNFVRMPKIRLPHGDAPAKLCQLLGHMSDRIGILVQSQDIGAGPYKRFRVTTATTGSIDDKRT